MPTRSRARPVLNCELLEERTLPSADLSSPSLLPAPADELSLPAFVLVADHGDGRMTLRSTMKAGNVEVGLTLDVQVPPGLSVRELLADERGKPDHASHSHRALAVGALTESGPNLFVWADEERDEVALQEGLEEPAVLANEHDGVLAPRAIRLGDLNGDGIL